MTVWRTRTLLIADLDIPGVAAGASPATVVEVAAATDLAAQILVSNNLAAAAPAT